MIMHLPAWLYGISLLLLFGVIAESISLEKPEDDPSQKTPETNWKYPFNHETRGGGGYPWKLFSTSFDDKAPGESLLDFRLRAESFVVPDEHDPIGQVCCPDDTVGKWFYNVTEPALVPFIVPEYRRNFKDSAIIVAPGGGFNFLAWFKEGTVVAKWLNSLGFSAFVLKYRIPDLKVPMKKSLIDAQRAVSLVRSRASEFGLNSSRIGFMGFSAGGILTAEVSYTTKRKYTGKDSVDKVSHMPDFALIIYGMGNPKYARYAPPTFLALAHNDQCVPALSAETYHRALRKHSPHSELHVFAEGRHGYGDCTMYTEGYRWREVCAWTANAEEFLHRQVLNKYPSVTSHWEQW